MVPPMTAIPENSDALLCATGMRAFCEQGRIVLEFVEDGKSVMKVAMVSSSAFEIAGQLYN